MLDMVLRNCKCSLDCYASANVSFTFAKQITFCNKNSKLLRGWGVVERFVCTDAINSSYLKKQKRYCLNVIVSVLLAGLSLLVGYNLYCQRGCNC